MPDVTRETLARGKRGSCHLVPAHLRHLDAGRRGRHPVHPAVAGSCRVEHDPDLHPGLDPAVEAGSFGDPSRQARTAPKAAAEQGLTRSAPAESRPSGCLWQSISGLPKALGSARP